MEGAVKRLASIGYIDDVDSASLLKSSGAPGRRGTGNTNGAEGTTRGIGPPVAGSWSHPTSFTFSRFP